MILLGFDIVWFWFSLFAVFGLFLLVWVCFCVWLVIVVVVVDFVTWCLVVFLLIWLGVVLVLVRFLGFGRCAVSLGCWLLGAGWWVWWFWGFGCWVVRVVGVMFAGILPDLGVVGFVSLVLGSVDYWSGFAV